MHTVVNYQAKAHSGHFVIKIDVLSLVVFIVLLGGLTTYIAYVSKSFGYVISASSIAFSSLLLLRNRKIATMGWRLLSVSTWFWLWGFALLGSQLMVTFQGLLSLEGLVRTIGYLMLFTMTYFILAPAALIRGEKVWPLLGCVLSVPSLIGIMGSIGVLPIGVQPWKIPIINLPQIRSIFMDSNYFGLVAFVGMVSSMYGAMLSKKRFLQLLWTTLSLINFVSFVLSYSRAAYFATCTVAIVWFLTSKKTRWPWKVSLSITTLVAFVVLANWAVNNPEMRAFLQINRGLTGRELLWPAALEAVAEKPLFGWGVGNVDDVVLGTISRWNSTHNTFLDFAIMTGIPGLIALMWIVVASMIPLLRKKGEDFHHRRFLLALLTGLLIICQFITFTPGGAGFASLIFALALGQANALRIQQREC